MTALHTSPRLHIPHREERTHLACALRWAARLDMHESVANHFSLAVSEDGAEFLMNPNGRHFSRIRASDIILVDANDPTTMSGPQAPDPTAWGLHGAFHRNCPQARCLLHVHPKFGTVLASLEDSSIPPIEQATARFFNRVVVDDGFDGMAFEDEGERCSRLLGDKQVMLLGNHGVLVVGTSIAQAFDTLYYFERASQTLVTAYMTGKPLRVMADEVAEKTARQWEAYPEFARNHWRELEAILDEEEPEYRL